MKGLQHDAGKAHILAGCYVDALLERGESVAHDAYLVPAGLDRQGHYGRVPDHATIDVELTPGRRPDEQAPHAHNGRASWRQPGSGWRGTLHWRAWREPLHHRSSGVPRRHRSHRLRGVGDDG